jgi:RNA polymerase sigma-70 factor (ECF subfamily)
VPGDPLLGTDARLDAEREIGQVVTAVEHLDPDDRDLLVLVVWEGCTSAEAARALGIPAGTVRSRLMRIRQQLREQGAPR